MKMKSPLDWAFAQRTGDPTANLILIIMSRRGNTTKQCFMSQERLVNESDCSLSTVGRKIRKLQNLGLIERVRGNGSRRSNTYRLCITSDSINHIDQFDRSNCNRKLSQVDRQNPKESTLESVSSSRPVVENLCKPVANSSDVARKRKSKPVAVGKVISSLIERFSM